MTFQEKWNVLFHKEECLKVVMFNEAKRGTIKIIRVGFGDSTFKLGNGSYNIENDKIYYLGGLPTLTYYSNNPIAIEPRDSKAGTYTSELFDKIVEIEVVKEIAKFTSDEGTPLKTVMIICTSIILLAIGISAYMVLGGIDTITEFNEAYAETIELIKQRILSGDLSG